MHISEMETLHYKALTVAQLNAQSKYHGKHKNE